MAENKPHETEIRPDTSVFPPGCRVSAFKRITVLLAEDHAVVRGGLCRLLAIGNHFKVMQARNGREAVEMAASLRPDVILLNVAMPVINGLQATRQILAANPTAKVIILSAHTDDVYLRRPLIGCNGFRNTSKSPLDYAPQCAGFAVLRPAAGEKVEFAGGRQGILFD